MKAVLLLLAFGLSAGVAAREKDQSAEGGDAARDARKRLLRAMDLRSQPDVESALEALVRAGGRDNIEGILRLIPQVPPSEDWMYWDLVRGACSFTDREALEHLGETILKTRGAGFSSDLTSALGRNTSKRVVFAFTPILQKGPPALQVMAAERIGEIRLKESVDALVDALKREEPKGKTELLDLIVGGLQQLTHQEFKTNSVNWEGWWQKNREKPLPEGPIERKEGQTSSGTVVDRLDRKRLAGFERLEKAPKKAVIVLSAEFPKLKLDKNNGKIQDTLEAMGIPHEIVHRPDFDGYDLRGVGAIIINCAQFHEHCICPTCKPSGKKENRLRQCSDCNVHKEFTAKLSNTAIKKIANFVKRGGFLFCEDWTVKEVLERAFPQHVSAGTVLREGVADVVPARGRTGHPYLKGIFAPPEHSDKNPWDEIEKEKEAEKPGEPGKDGKPGKREGGTVARKPEPKPEPGKEPAPELVKVKHHWTIDDESWAFHLSDTSKVTVLLTSPTLQKEAPGENVVAFCFRPSGDNSDTGGPGKRRKGPGMVMQVLSHFGKQKSAVDEATLQNLLLNFLLAADTARTQDDVASKKGGKKKKKDEKKEEGEKGEDEEGEDTEESSSP